MSTKLKKSLITAGKFAGWTIASVLLTHVTVLIGGIKDPNYVLFIPVVAGFLKSIATYVATETQEAEAELKQ